MELINKYQQDTVKVINLKQQPDSIWKTELKVQRSQILLMPIQERDTNIVQPVRESNIEVPRIPTKAQIRYSRWQQEQKLVIGNSRYLNMNDEVGLAYTEKAEDKNLALPNYKIQTENTDWLTILLIAILVLFATIRVNYSNYMSNLFRSIFNNSTSTRMFQEKNISVANGAFRLEVFFYFTFSVFIFHLFRYFELDLPFKNVGLFIFSLGLVLVYFLGKKLVYRSLGIISEGVEETSEYLFNMDNINRIMGLVLFPIVLLITFYPGNDAAIPVFMGIATTITLYLLLLYRGIIILLNKQFSIYYLFLYFCTLEFLPLVLLYKIVVL